MSTPIGMDPDEIDLRRSDITTFVDRLPDPTEIIRWGGLPGVEYLMIDSRNLHEATNTEPATKQEAEMGKWTLCRDVPLYTVVGPAGQTTMMVLGRGRPIHGADPANGIRTWFYDRTLLTSTGLKSPYNHVVDQEAKPEVPKVGKA